MSIVTFIDRLQTSITNTPGTGSMIIGSAVSGFITFSSVQDGQYFDILVTNGTDWEIDEKCLYTDSSTTLSRGTFLSSSTNSPLSLDSSAIVSVVLLSERTIPITITSPTNGQVITYSSTNGWINQNAPSGGSSLDLVSYTMAGGL